MSSHLFRSFLPLRRPLTLALLLAMLGSSAAVQSADGHASADKPDATKEAASLDQLRKRLNDRIEATGKAGATTGQATVHVRVRPERAARSVARAEAAMPPDAASLAASWRAESAARAQHELHWSYDGESGPAAWGVLKPSFSTCANGQRQSPIDIRGGLRVDLEPIKFDYQPTGFNVIDNGHTVQANLGGGNAIEVNGRRFDLVQFHFHRPSEERINGRQYEMVVHMVHKDPEGRLAVVAVLIEQGKAHPVVQAVWNSLPLEKHEEQMAPNPIDLKLLLPEDQRYYTYMGSLTTPPCSEGVLWLVMKQPVSLSPEQIGLFARLYPMNARPIQAGSNRMIKESN